VGSAAILLEVTKELPAFFDRFALFSIVFGARGLALDNEQRRRVFLLGRVGSALQDGDIAFTARSSAPQLIAFFQNECGGVIALVQQTADAFQHDKVFRVIEITRRAVSQDDGARVINDFTVGVNGNDIFTCCRIVEPAYPAAMSGIFEAKYA